MRQDLLATLKYQRQTNRSNAAKLDHANEVLKQISDIMMSGRIPEGNERHVLAKLAMEGPQSIRKLRSRIDPLKLSPRGIAIGYSESLYDLQVRRAVEELEKRGFAKTVDTDKPNVAQYADLTFNGLLWYIKYGGDPDKSLARAKDSLTRQSHSEKKKGKSRKKNLLKTTFHEILPFHAQWLNIKEELAERFLAKLAETADRFRMDVEKVEVKAVGMQVFAPCEDAFKPTTQGNYYPVKNSDVAAYLMTHEADLLRECYFVFLINNDLYYVSDLDYEEAKQLLPSLKSAMELSAFEDVKDPVATILSEEGLGRFFPKYSGIEYYFTGSFVNNFLWDKEPFNDYTYDI